MSPWIVGAVADAPHIVLLNWSVFEVPYSQDTRHTTRHFVGLEQEFRHVRVSSPVLAFDPLGRRGVTRSGRVYELRGRSGADADARYVWARWKAMNRVLQEWDVTAEVVRDIQQA
jgi:hypothetical protein